MYKKRLLAVAILAGLSVSLAACGGSDDDSPDPTPPAPQPEPGPGPSPTPDPGPGPAPEPGPGPTPDPGPGPGPGPSPEPTPDPGTGGSGECFNLDLFQVGTTWRLEYNVSGVTTGTSQSEARVVRRTDFAGRSALETELTNTTALAGVPVVSNTVFNYADTIGGNLIEQYGNILTTSLAGISTRTVVTFVPPWSEMRWALGAGQTETYNYTLRSETTITGSPVPLPPSVVETAVSGTLTYQGRESVTVPLGTFNACKFTQVSDGDTTVEWYAPGTGLAVKTVTTDGGGGGSSTLEMTVGRVNGVSIVP